MHRTRPAAAIETPLPGATRSAFRTVVLAVALFAMASGALAAEGSGDLNGNGKLDGGDLRGLNALCMKKPASHEVSCAPADLDKDGRVTPKEFFAEMRPKGEVTRESAEYQLQKNCINKPADAKLSCSAVDMNGDGLVAPDDFFVLRAKVNAAKGDKSEDDE